MSLIGKGDLISFLDDVAKEAEDLQRNMDDPAHAELLRQMRDATIPERSGDLAASLRDPNSPQHVWDETSKGYDFGSMNRAAKYNPVAVPDIDVDALTLVIAEVLE